jgi:uncharacterized SAM-binding protein YcdF (DUF218 family)
MRTLWLILQPSNALALLALLSAVLWLAGRRRSARRLLGTAAAALLAVVALPLDGWLTAALETRFPHPTLPAQVDGIVTLGGAVNTDTTERWGRPQINERVERLTEAAVLSRRYPEATLLVSGGHWRPEDALSEAEVARRLFAEIGLPIEHAVFEERSTTTWENAVYSRALVRPEPGQTWVLVTSAYHMPRAVGVFRRLGWPVIPYPVDYHTSGRAGWDGRTSVGFRLAGLDFIAREWAALAAYRLMGRTDALLPR